MTDRSLTNISYIHNKVICIMREETTIELKAEITAEVNLFLQEDM